MKVEFVGTGGAFDYQLGNSAALVAVQGKTVLIDAGHLVYGALREKKLASAMEAILLTHFHDDHVGSLSSLILHQVHLSESKKPLTILYPDEPFKDLIQGFLSYSLGLPQEKAEFVSLNTFPGITAIETTGKHIEWMKSFAYVFEEGDQVVAYSGDLGDPDIVFDWLRKQDMTGATVFHEVAFDLNLPHHSYYKDLEKHLSDFTIYGYHCDPANKPNDCLLPLVEEVGRVFEWA